MGERISRPSACLFSPFSGLGFLAAGRFNVWLLGAAAPTDKPLIIAHNFYFCAFEFGLLALGFG